MKRLEFACDGCDTVSHCDVPPSGNVADYMLDGWTSNRIMLEENGSRVIDLAADLCPVCADNLRSAMDPSRWPKVNDPMKNQFEKLKALELVDCA
jgi:hypothetical protein